MVTIQTGVLGRLVVKRVKTELRYVLVTAVTPLRLSAETIASDLQTKLENALMGLVQVGGTF